MMNARLSFLLIIILLSLLPFAHGQWVLSSDPQGPTNRYGSGSWIDSEGNFWIFGGYGSSNSSIAAVFFGDLWMYNGTSWALQAGLVTVNITGNTTTPGSRQGMMTWTNSAKTELYLFGGANMETVFSDMWVFNLSIRNWTMLSDHGLNYTGSFPSSSNSNGTPPALYQAMTWSDNDTFYMFGGKHDGNQTNTPFANDLWKFVLSQQQWFWMNGDKLINTRPNTNQIGQPAGRWYSSSFFRTGYLWLFGGYNASYLNDMWKYDIQNNVWHSVLAGGTSIPNIQGSYNGVNHTGIPYSRYAASAWTDDDQNFWLFGGSAQSGQTLSDLWMYSNTSWILVAGNNTFNLRDQSNPSYPGAVFGAACQVNNNGALLMFAGELITGLSNQLWTYSGTPNSHTISTTSLASSTTVSSTSAITVASSTLTSSSSSISSTTTASSTSSTSSSTSASITISSTSSTTGSPIYTCDQNLMCQNTDNTTVISPVLANVTFVVESTVIIVGNFSLVNKQLVLQDSNLILVNCTLSMDSTSSIIVQSDPNTCSIFSNQSIAINGSLFFQPTNDIPNGGSETFDIVCSGVNITGRFNNVTTPYNKCLQVQQTTTNLALSLKIVNTCSDSLALWKIAVIVSTTVVGLLLLVFAAVWLWRNRYLRDEITGKHKSIIRHEHSFHSDL